MKGGGKCGEGGGRYRRQAEVGGQKGGLWKGIGGFWQVPEEGKWVVEWVVTGVEGVTKSRQMSRWRPEPEAGRC